MRKDIIEKVLYYGIYDTALYRYALKCFNGIYGIYRLSIDKLDTMSVYQDWELVKEL